MSHSRWLPLESNPDVINRYLKAIGVPTEWQCSDIWGFDDDALKSVKSPLAALFLLFPVTDKYEQFSKSQVESLKGATVPQGLYFMQQHIGNACGTIAIVHALANNQDKIKFDANGVFKKFLDSSKSAKPEDRSKLLESDDAMAKIHESSAGEGQTATPSRDDKINLHFIAFVEHGGTLYELDGRKPFPISHGKSNQASFLKDAVGQCRKFMEREPENYQFTAMALTGGN